MSVTAKTERIRGTDAKIPVSDNGEKISSGVIECSVNMNVSLSNAERSKIFQRTQSLLIVIAAIVFAILCFHLKREVRALEVQMNCVNSNLMMLMLRYEKLNKNFNRMWYHRVGHHNLSVASNSSKKFDGKPSIRRHSSSRRESVNSIGREKRVKSSTIATYGPRFLDATSVNDARPFDDNFRSDVADEAPKETRFVDAESKDAKTADRDRYERAIVAFERRNREGTTAMPNLRDDFYDDAETRTETRGGRSRRDDGRGPVVATFVGAIPEQNVTNTVYVGPWVSTTRNESRYAFKKFHLVEEMKSIEVTANGLYMISAQIYYFGEPTYYSYWILLRSEGSSHTRRVIKCATVSDPAATEASCYTSVVLPLQKGDRLLIQQQERNRLINLREGHSYVQIVLLSGESPRRRAS